MIHAHNCGDAVFLLLAKHWGLFRLSNVQHGFPNAEGAWNLPPGSETFLFHHVSVSKLARPASVLKVSHLEKVQDLGLTREVG